jgi:tRNA dimethylallyltransferase
MGPTAAGKTALALELADRLPVEIVSVDSAMVYRGMDIGTAKPDAALRARVVHHLIDLREPEAAYSAGDFIADAQRVIGEILARGRVPLLTGGTMLYFRALQSGLANLPARDPAVRALLDARAQAQGWPALHAELALVDPLAAARIAPGDSQRIQRALEVYALSGRPLSALQAEDLRGASQAGLKLVVSPADRAVLHERIGARFAQMLAAGFVEEVRGLRARPGLDASTPSMRAVGYRQVGAHLAGECSLDAAITAAVTATRQLAKRQLTWLRAEPGAHWFDPTDPKAPERLLATVAEWLQRRPKA